MIKCGSPMLSKKHHLFAEGDRSMCGKWLYTGEKYEVDLASFGKRRDDCAPCSKRYQKHLQPPTQTK